MEVSSLFLCDRQTNQLVSDLHLTPDASGLFDEPIRGLKPFYAPVD